MTHDLYIMIKHLCLYCLF